MNSRETAFLILRIFALYIIVINFQSSMYSASVIVANFSMSSPPAPFFSYMPLLASLLPLAFAAYLWVSAKKLCSLFILEPSTSLINENDYSLNILKIAMVIIGIYLMVTSIPHILQTVTSFLLLPEDVRSLQPSYTNILKQNLVLYGIQIAIGLFMIVGNKFLVRWINKARTFGIEK